MVSFSSWVLESTDLQSDSCQHSPVSLNHLLLGIQMAVEGPSALAQGTVTSSQLLLRAPEASILPPATLSVSGCSKNLVVIFVLTCKSICFSLFLVFPEAGMFYSESSVLL